MFSLLFSSKLKFVKRIKVAIAEICNLSSQQSLLHIYCLRPEKSINLVQPGCCQFAICKIRILWQYNAINPVRLYHSKTTVTRARVSYCPAQLKFTILCKLRVESPGQLLVDILTFTILVMI